MPTWEFNRFLEGLEKTFTPKRYKTREALNVIINTFIGLEKQVLIRAMNRIQASFDNHIVVEHAKLKQENSQLKVRIKRLENEKL